MSTKRYLEIGVDLDGQVVINHPGLKPDLNGVGHIVFSPRQARNLARILIKKADEAEKGPRVWRRRKPPSQK